MSAATAAGASTGASAAPDIEAAAANIDINRGLNSFQIVPKLITCCNYTNMDFFTHMITHRNRNVDA